MKKTACFMIGAVLGGFVLATAPVLAQSAQSLTMQFIDYYSLNAWGESLEAYQLSNGSVDCVAFAYKYSPDGQADLEVSCNWSRGK